MTVRDNSARFQAPVPDVPPSDTTEESIQTPPASDGLQFVVPTELVDLPTKGLFYPQGHPLHGKEEVEIKLMTAKEEDILVNKSLLKKGIALDRMLQSLIVTPGVHLEDLCVGDKNALIVASRISAYGADYKASITCPVCSVAQDFTFNLEEGNLITPADLEFKEATQTERGTFAFTLPKTQAVVETRLLTGRDEKRLVQNSKKNKNEFTLTDQFKTFIVAVNGVTDKNLVAQFIDIMPAFDSKYLRSNYAKMVPNIDLTQFFECSSCDHAQDMEVPFTVEFFWPRS